MFVSFHSKLYQVLLGVAVALPFLLAGSATADEPWGIIDPFGNSHWVHPSRLQPGANVAIPGSQQTWFDPATGAYGTRYMGLDGRWHGNTTIQNGDGTTQGHTYYARPTTPTYGSGQGYQKSRPNPTYPTYGAKQAPYMPRPKIVGGGTYGGPSKFPR